MLQNRILFVFTIIALSACQLVEVNKGETDYPVRVQALSMDSLLVKNQAYQQFNPNICSTLNEYAFTGFSRVLFVDDVNPCLNRDVVRIELHENEEYINLAKAALVRNGIYTGISNPEDLVVRESVPLYGCTICEGPDINNVPIEWKVTFEPQKYQSKTVRGTGITVQIDARGVNRIWGNWYTTLPKPDFITFGYEHVQESLIGLKIDLRSFTGEEKIYTVTAEDLTEIPILEYYPQKSETTLELRQAWAVPITFTPDYFEGWLAFVDAIDGTFIDLIAQ